MDIIETLTNRIESYRATNKNPCKNYATREAALKATFAMAQQTANRLAPANEKNPLAARYVVFYVEPWGRWVGAVDMTELLRRKNYGGYAVCPGFFAY